MSLQKLKIYLVIDLVIKVRLSKVLDFLGLPHSRKSFLMELPIPLPTLFLPMLI